MRKDYLKVEGREGLVKDPSTGAVINTDKRGLEAAKHAKRKVLEEQAKTRELEERVKRLEAMFQQMIEKEQTHDSES